MHTSLIHLDCSENPIKILDVSKNINLAHLSCRNNKLGLDLSNNTNLKTLYCSDNNLKILDLSNNSQLIKLSCVNNKLPHWI